MQANLKEGFRRISLLVYGCWIVGWLIWFWIYTPYEDAVSWLRIESGAADFNYSQCKNRIDAVAAKLKSDIDIETMVKGLTGGSQQPIKDRSDSFIPNPYGTDNDGKPLTKDQALKDCESTRRRAQIAFEKRSFSSYLRAEYVARFSANEGVAFIVFVFLTPMVAYYSVLGLAWAGLRAGRWIRRGFDSPGNRSPR